MSSVAKEVKRALNEGRKKRWKVFSDKDLKELEEYMAEDEDFYSCFCNYGNIAYYNSFEESVEDFIKFLKYDLEDFADDPDDEGVHQWYILDEPDMATSYMTLKSGKIANLDNLYNEYKSVCSSM